MFDALGVEDDVTLVIHDWGSAMGFSWAQQHAARVKGLVYMEAIAYPPGGGWPAPPPGAAFDLNQSPQGEQAVLQENRFVEGVIRGLGYYLTEADAAEYRRPFLEPGESRRPNLTWSREVPRGGEPKVNHDIIRAYSDWLVAETEIPKLFVRVEPRGFRRSGNRQRT